LLKKLNPDFFIAWWELNWDANLNGCELNLNIIVHQVCQVAISKKARSTLKKSPIPTRKAKYTRNT